MYLGKMIKTKKQLKEYIRADSSRYEKSRRRFKILSFLYGDESYSTLRLLYFWRKTEYFYNTLDKKKPWSIILLCFNFFIYRQLQIKNRIILPLNVIGPGLYIPHRVGGVIINALQIGRNFTISSGCVVGKKNTEEQKPIIGNDVECCIGAKIIGKVVIGNNVVIAPNSVVIKDVPDNVIVSGVPSTIIKAIKK